MAYKWALWETCSQGFGSGRMLTGSGSKTLLAEFFNFSYRVRKGDVELSHDKLELRRGNISVAILEFNVYSSQ